MISHKTRLFLSGIIFGLIFLGGFKSTQAGPTEKLKIGFITVGPISDWGYNYAHNQGRLYLQSHMPNEVETSIVENIPESAEVERVMEKMIADGTRLIFSTSYGYLEPALRVAERHPDVTFAQAVRYKTTPNLMTYVGEMYEPMYLAGIVAGHMTKSNKLGYVAAHSVPLLIQDINAFTLGARSVNPKATVNVIWTHSWSDPPTEAEAAKDLIALGADVLAMTEDSPITVAQTAERAGIYTIGFHADLQKYAPKGWLTGAMWNWGPLYARIARSVRAGTWKPEEFRGGMDTGVVKLAPFGPAVPEKVQKEVLAMEQKIVKRQYVPFQGPVVDRDGKQRLAEGQRPDFDWLEKMDWFVPGVIGSTAEK